MKCKHMKMDSETGLPPCPPSTRSAEILTDFVDTWLGAPGLEWSMRGSRCLEAARKRRIEILVRTAVPSNRCLQEPCLRTRAVRDWSGCWVGEVQGQRPRRPRCDEAPASGSGRSSHPPGSEAGKVERAGAWEVREACLTPGHSLHPTCSELSNRPSSQHWSH